MQASKQSCRVAIVSCVHADPLYVPPQDLAWPDEAVRCKLRVYRDGLKQWYNKETYSAPPPDVLHEPLKHASYFGLAVKHMRCGC